MRIVFLNPAGRLGGAERSLLDLLASLRQAKPEWLLHLIVAEPGPLIEEARSLGVEAELLAFPRRLAGLGDAWKSAGGRIASQLSLFPYLLGASPAAAVYALRLRKRLEALAPEMIHTNGFKMHLLGRWARPAATPLVWHIRDYVSQRRVMPGLLRLHAGRNVVAVANSRSVAQDVSRVCGEGIRVCPVYNAVNLDRFSPLGPRLDLDAAAGMVPAPAGTVRVGLVATFSLWKGHETFLKALSLLPADIQVRGYIVGDAIYQTRGSQHSLDHLREMARALGLAGRVGFTGFLEDTSSVMRSLDIVVHASTHPEPFGLVILEAMACARAVVVSWAGGAAEIVSVGEDSLAHPPGDSRGLSEAIATLARDPDLRARLGRSGRLKAERGYDRSRLAESLIPIYEQAAGLGPEPRS